MIFSTQNLSIEFQAYKTHDKPPNHLIRISQTPQNKTYRMISTTIGKLHKHSVWRVRYGSHQYITSTKFSVLCKCVPRLPNILLQTVPLSSQYLNIIGLPTLLIYQFNITLFGHQNLFNNLSWKMLS